MSDSSLPFNEADFLNGAVTLAEEYGRQGVPRPVAHVDAYNEMRFMMVCGSPLDWGRRSDVDYAEAQEAVKAIHPQAPMRYFDWVNNPASSATPEEVSGWADELLSAVDAQLPHYAQALPGDLLNMVLQKGQEANASLSGQFSFPPLES